MGQPSVAPPPYLSPREHMYLWLMAHGRTPTEAKVILKTTSTPALATRIKEKLGARTFPQAVYIACQSELLGPSPDCGRPKGYRAHVRAGEDPCPACRRVYTDQIAHCNDLRATVRPDLTEPELRLLRAFDSGRSFKQVLGNWGCSRRTLDDVRTGLYRKLRVSHLPQGSRYAAALEEGRLWGFLRPAGQVLAPAQQLLRPAPRGVRLTPLQILTLKEARPGVSLSQAGLKLGGIPSSHVSSRLMDIYRKLDVLDHGHGERRQAAYAKALSLGYEV